MPVLQWRIFGCQELAGPHEIGDSWRGWLVLLSKMSGACGQEPAMPHVSPQHDHGELLTPLEGKLFLWAAIFVSHCYPLSGSPYETPKALPSLWKSFSKQQSVETHETGPQRRPIFIINIARGTTNPCYWVRKLDARFNKTRSSKMNVAPWLR